jgi:hypothetical protein
MNDTFGYEIFYKDGNKLVNGSKKYKADIGVKQPCTWQNSLQSFNEPSEVVFFNRGIETLKKTTQHCNQKFNLLLPIVIVKFKILQGVPFDCRLFEIADISPWTIEMENEYRKEIDKEKIDNKDELEKDIINNPERYSDPSFIFTSFDITPILSLEDLKQSVQKAYEAMDWHGYYDGSRGEAMDDGETKIRIEMLYSLGRKLGLKLVDPPDFDSEDRMQWSGKDGLELTDDEDE